MMTRRWILTAAMAGSILALGCSDTAGPGVEPEIRNIADSFEFQVSELDRYPRTLTLHLVQQRYLCQRT